MWVAQGTSYIYAIAQNGTISHVMASPAAQGPVQIAIDAKDRIYVTGGKSLYRSEFRWLLGRPSRAAPFSSALGTDASGNVYLVQGGPNTYVVNDDGTLTLKYPNFGEFSVTFDPMGNPWESNGYLTTYNATGIANVGFLAGYSGDGGPAQSAAMGTFDSIATGPDGNVYFEEFNRIRRLTGSGPAAAPVIAQGGIVNAVNYSGGSLAPGELISIFGSNFGVAGLEVSSAVNDAMPFTMGRTKVLFNGQPGAITAITPTQINVFVPYRLAAGAPGWRCRFKWITYFRDRSSFRKAPLRPGSRPRFSIRMGL